MKTRSLTTSRRHLVFTALILCAALLATSRAHAQSGLLGFERSLVIQMNPQYPRPGDIVSLKVTSPIQDISEGEIAWTTNGKPLSSGTGELTAQIELGPLGSRTVIGVNVITDNGEAFGEMTIIPTEIDLLVDTDAYVPPFYRGRALPSVGTTVYLEAKPRFLLPSGASVPTSDIFFTWKKNNDTLTALSGKGKSVARIPLQNLFGTYVVSVEAYTSDRSLSGRATHTLTHTPPAVLLYQDHPLYGIMYHRALTSPATFSENEITFALVPFFAQATSPNDPGLTFAWSVNGQSIPADANNPSRITINADNSSGEALLKLGLSHKTNYFFSSDTTWNMTLSSREPSSATFSPFTE